MNQLVWATAQGNIANLGVGIPVSLDLIAVNLANNGSTLTYTVISGSLPDGMSMSSSGVISGTPAYQSSSNNYGTTPNYPFIVRVTSSDGSTPIDGSFSIALTVTVNTDFTWVTVGGDLGTFPSDEFYQLPLTVENSTNNSTVTFMFLSGELPPGMQVVASGFLQGVPTISDPTVVDQSQLYRFSIRAQTGAGHVRDQAFSISITNVNGPEILPNNETSVYNLGDFFDGSYYTQQFYVDETNPNIQIQWSVVDSLPPGLSLSSSGLISGYILPSYTVGAYGPAGFDGDAAAPGQSGAIIQNAEYGSAPYDFNQQGQTVAYRFTLKAYDGVNYTTQTYILNVINRSDFTADNQSISTDIGDLTIDSTSTYIPIILNASTTTLPAARGGAYYAYKFDGFDFKSQPFIYNITNNTGTFDADVAGIDDGFDYNGDDITHLGGIGFDSFNTSAQGTNNLPGLILDPQTGWLYGKLTPQMIAYQSYEFGVNLTKTLDGQTYTSQTYYFTLPVLGDINNTITWSTESDLGVINNGQVSEFVLQAVNNEGNQLVYSLVDQAGVSIRLPQGLTLMPSGEISGRVSFEVFTLDQFTTDFDTDTTVFDSVYTFNVTASTLDGLISSQQQFTLTMNVVDQKPYNNVYVRALPTVSQRSVWNNLLTNPDIFPTQNLYRPDDPWFGIASNIEMLFLPGLNPTDLNSFEEAIQNNHYNKTYTFGDVKTAVVLDSSYNIKYEVVYVEVIDPEENASNAGPGLEIDLTNVIANPYIDAQGNTFKIAYPNTSEDMIARLVQNIGYADQSSLPEWMSSNQPSTTPGTFTVPLGFTRGVVLAYTQPNKSALIAYRINTSGINFNTISFTVDRYFVDNFYSTNYNTVTQQYYSGRETTFDTLPNQNVGTIVATVNYALSVPFSEINGRPVEYIIANGGMDGYVDFQQGDTLIFAKQENFLNAGTNDGWVDYIDSYIGDDILTPTVEGYDSEGFDSNTLIPGYLEKLQSLTIVNGQQNYSVVNQRGGVWQINIVDGIVNLQFVQEIQTAQRIRVILGSTYSGAILYYNQILSVGQNVPNYSIYRVQSASIKARTSFNGDSTRFFSYRDSYYAPGTEDVMLKFPQTTMFK
jgi:hypothetical protein